MSRIKNVNTNTNINRININVPRQRNAKITPKSVKKAEQDLQSLETQDRQIQYSSQAPSQFINPSVFGFNTTPINTGAIQEPEQQMQEPVRPMETQTETAITEDDFLASPRSPRMAVAEPVNIKEFMPQRGDTPREPIPFRSSGVSERRDVLALGYSQPQYRLPTDFQNRLAQQEGFEPSSRTFKPLAVGKMRDINKQGRPDINLMAQNVKEAYRGEDIVPFAKEAAVETEDQPKRRGGGRPVGSKNKPKPKAVETQVGPSLAANVNTPQDEVLSAATQFAQAKIVPKPKGALRGKKDD
jgi:hypothetical protein